MLSARIRASRTQSGCRRMSGSPYKGSPDNAASVLSNTEERARTRGNWPETDGSVLRSVVAHSSSDLGRAAIVSNKRRFCTTDRNVFHHEIEKIPTRSLQVPASATNHHAASHCCMAYRRSNTFPGTCRPARSRFIPSGCSTMTLVLFRTVRQ